jgi:short-subunit dehydrogenase
MSRILIIGATSAIAQTTARLFAVAGGSLFLAGRNAQRLQAVADDLKVRGANLVETRVLDVLDYARHKSLVDEAAKCLGGLDLMLVAYGTLPDQSACEASFETARREFEINALSVLSLLTHAANYFEPRRQGTIAVITSVAGDRGRQSNYLYGTAKGTITLFLQGLRNRLHRSGVNVITVKPGFVDTPMTREYDKGLLWAQPEKVAADIDGAVRKNRDVVYTPWFWRYIMLLIRLIPEKLFKTLKL